MLTIGSKAPEFELQDQLGKIHKLSYYKGDKVLLYFYPKDDTPGCTKEACDLRDNYKTFNKLKVTIIGISNDNIVSHKKFIQKHNLPFTLLADDTKKVVKEYGVWKLKKFMGKEYMGIVRTSFLIDEKGIIIKIYQNVNAFKHAQMVLDDLQQMV